MKVKNREEAWREADRLFPTDYEKDEGASQRAGYPIYRSTAAGNDSWISDLNTSIELSIVFDGGKRTKTVRIVIELEPEIDVVERWSSGDVRDMCIKHDWYRAGTVREYRAMLDIVDSTEPTTQNIYKIAKDILDHSDDEGLYVEAIMFEISREVVRRFYTVTEA